MLTWMTWFSTKATELFIHIYSGGSTQIFYVRVLKYSAVKVLQSKRYINVEIKVKVLALKYNYRHQK